MTLPVGSLLYFDTGTDANTPVWTKVSEHNRSSASVDIERIEKTQRMSNGSLRKIWIADKKLFSASWGMLPTYNAMTIDGGMGASEIQSFYLNKGKGAFKVKISYNGVTTRDEIISMVFTSCNFTIMKRNVRNAAPKLGVIPPDAQEFWDVSLSLEEV